MTNPTDKPTFDLAAIGVQPTPERPQTQSQSTGKKSWGPKPGVFTFYKVRSTTQDPSNKNRIITKFNSDLDMESEYNMNWIESNNGGYYDCQCPASKFDCRHKSILKDIELAQQVNSDRFFCFETRTFKLATEIS